VAKKQNLDTALFDTLRATGLRKKVARSISTSGARASQEHSLVVTRTARGLRMAADAIENRTSLNSGTAEDQPRKNARSTAGSRARQRTAGSKRAPRGAPGTAKSKPATSKRATPTRTNQRRTRARTQPRTRARS
jgi:hypothetical protein